MEMRADSASSIVRGRDERPRVDRPATLNGELLALLGRNSRRMPLPVFLACLLIAAVIYDNSSGAGPVLWLLAVVAFLGVRYAVLSRLPHRHDWSEEARLRLAVILSGANGTLHATCMIFFPDLGEFDRLLVTILILALCAGAVGSTAGYRPVFLAYITPMLVPLSALWILVPEAGTGWREHFVAALTLLFGVLLYMLARDAFRLFRESFEIRLEQVELNRRLEQALEDSRTAEAAKSRFLAAASHDLRQPVHALTLFSAALSYQNLDERGRMVAGHIERALDALSLQLDALLDVSRLDTGAVKPRSTSFRLEPMCDRLQQQFRLLAENKGLAFEISCNADAAVATDEMLLEQICRNLLSNAIKYTDEGSVRLEVVERKGGWAVCVSDTGRGIPDAARQQIFEEFYQLENPERDRAKGLGLGLAIVKRLVDLLDLSLTVDSEEGRGSTFRLEVPGACTVEPPRAREEEDRSLAGVRVLVVDDEIEVLEATKALLQGLGCEVQAAGDSGGALDVVKDEAPDIVLCDYRLRGHDNGLDTIRRLRDLVPALPAIIVTGDARNHELRECQHAGILVLHKPARAEDLKAVIHHMINTRFDAEHGHEQPLRGAT